MSQELPVIPGPSPGQVATVFWTLIGLAILFIILYVAYAMLKR
jgi:uncharacterized phage infection (PIP) family protein YhgE